jgi:hypothetical protein
MLHELSYAREIIKKSAELGINIELMENEKARDYINYVLEKFHPWRTSGHLSIGGQSREIPTEKNEFSFSLSLPYEPAYIFFEQNKINRNNVVIIENAKIISELMGNCFGMEYFISNEEVSYLIAVNWYVIEYTEGIEI